MTETELAYIAGIVDGDGYILISRSPKANKYRRGFSYSMVTGVDNTNQWLIDYLHFNFGGTKYVLQQDPKWKPVWHWKVAARKAYEFLKLISPYLVIKKPQAELAIAFQERRNKKRYTNLLSDEEFAVQEAKAILVGQLNRRGVER